MLTHTHTVEWSSCSMHVMRADSETLSVREKYSGQWAAHAVSRADAVATGCSFHSVLEHCPGKLVNATCSQKTAGCLLETNDIIEMPVRTDWHRRLYSFAKIKSIIDEDGRGCGGEPRANLAFAFSWFLMYFVLYFLIVKCSPLGCFAKSFFFLICTL